MASARVIDVQQLGIFVPFSDPNVLAKLIPRLFPFVYGHLGTERKSDSWLAALRKALFKQF